ncbi:DUF2059 domain-containing protein [Chamaesiphon sp. GL140_3_metabinner_50]|uniref:DUF2059 domain-containing protein n=1 Tax=Chamaesiphon sp. GL140_3_metabinner_50 TaxID=2970812 RepID=UPI0025D6E794|nr:DUF2059 domain-containing protein [Chamaesiphon sp. GL140_3_metabinner_50]
MSVEFQDEYADALDNLVPALQDSYERMKQQYSPGYKFDYSQAVANRLRAFYATQLGIKKILDKKFAQAGSDFFVETILFFLILFNDLNGLELEIKSEQTIQPKRNALRPDITIWRGLDLLAVIECKTQLGWHRHDWKSHFESREEKIKEVFPNAKIFLVVMTSCNWSGFGEDERVGKQLFCLLKDIWPTSLSKCRDPEIFDTRIEYLFEEINVLSHK